MAISNNTHFSILLKACVIYMDPLNDFPQAY